MKKAPSRQDAMKKLLAEGYSLQTEEDIKDWDVTAGDGIEED